MNRKAILDAAAECVLKHRQTQYGKPEDVFGVIAGLWSAYLGKPLQAHDVAALMVLLKVGRVSGNPAHGDTWVDIAGYAACGGELAAMPAMVPSDEPITSVSVDEKPRIALWQAGLGEK